MPSRRLTDLAAELQPLAAEFLDICDARFSPRARVILVCTYRSKEEQAALKSKYGNTRPIAAPGKSLHNLTLSDGTPAARAFDAMAVEHGKLVLDGSDHLYAEMGSIAKSLGLVWGGDFSRPDPDHFQMG